MRPERISRPVQDVAIDVLPDAAAASRAAAESFVTLAQATVDRLGSFAVALSGGTAPRLTYRLLGREPLRSAVPWEAVHLFWGDERCVPPGHERSNFGMAHREMIAHLPIPQENVHRMRGELPPGEGAAQYLEELAGFFGGGVPRFDLIHLGVGPDGHTCSLFPFDPLLHDRERVVAVALHRPLGEWRITLTVPVLLAAAQIEVLAHGAAKSAVVREALYGPLDPVRLPIQLVRLEDEMPRWYLDAAAAASLP